MLPHVAGRPLTLVRCPDGRHKHCFFQKHPGAGVPEAVARVTVREKQGEQAYMVVHDAMGLAALAQLGALEIHTWGCHADKAERPDLLVFDLDPDEALPFSAVIEAALAVRDELKQVGLESFVKTTGGKGLHVTVPLTRRHDWDAHHRFARGLVERVRARTPERFVTTSRKEQRKGHVFLDYLRNARGATFVAPYSTRARAGAPVAMPLHWPELEQGLDPSAFDVKHVIERMHALDVDPWHDLYDTRQSLTVAMLKTVGAES
jgi:bifunctional non-homologous end joining protein LigD